MQYNKVELCGVNTAKLKVLSEDEKRELLIKMRDGSPAERSRAREEMINGNLRLVLSVIQRFAGRGENLDDLFQVGVIGLIKAIDNFDVDLDVRFSTYGVPMVYSAGKTKNSCQTSGIMGVYNVLQFTGSDQNRDGIGRVESRLNGSVPSGGGENAQSAVKECMAEKLVSRNHQRSDT